MQTLTSSILDKYNKYVPRYTSYPTAAVWKENIDPEEWKVKFSQVFDHQNLNGISLYIHLPFCESLCTYCACNKKVTTNHAVEGEYLLALQKEWLLYRRVMKQTPVIREIHLGGGTPTFFSPQNLQRLLQFLLKDCIIHPNHEFSVEGHPNNTTNEHLQVLAEAGFTRISFGIQDTNKKVQEIINRVQPVENVKRVTENARANGFTSVNYDLIYGLPSQTIRTIEQTIKQVNELNPDRLAFYAYAHVPKQCRSQRLFSEDDLPSAETKMEMQRRGRELLINAGYAEIGMDHFAKPIDNLFRAQQMGKLHRNFMGYTVQETGLLLGLGVTAISDIGIAFAQNHKSLLNYYREINNGRLTVIKGHHLDEEDQILRGYITEISCRGRAVFKPEHQLLLEQFAFGRLSEMHEDGLVKFSQYQVLLTDLGQFFMRHVCSAFDKYHVLLPQ